MLRQYQKSLKERFNEEFIRLRDKENIVDYVSDICKALQVVEGVEFLGCDVVTDESKFKTRGRENSKFVSIEESRLNLITMKFRISQDGKQEVIEKSIYVPKLVDGFYFQLNSSRYYPILQVVDKSTYNSRNAVVLKTLLMPIILRFKKTLIVDSAGKKYSGKVFSLNLFRHNVNILHYYLGHTRMSSVLQYFGFGEEDMGFVANSDITKEDVEKKTFFQFNKKNSLYVSKALLRQDSERRNFVINFVATLLNILNNRSNTQNVHDLEYWKKRLGGCFTKNTNNQLEKTKKILLSFKRILDSRTKFFLKVSPEDKKSIFSIIRWMMVKYETLMRKDNFDLANKRIRLSEYLVFPLLLKFSNSTYRILNSKSVTFGVIKSMFNISPGFLISKLVSNELLRYNGATNAIDLFTSALRFTCRGPQSMSAKSGASVSIRYRGIHPSYIGKVSLTASSAGDPGLSGMLTPFVKAPDLFFSEEME